MRATVWAEASVIGTAEMRPALLGDPTSGQAADVLSATASSSTGGSPS